MPPTKNVKHIVQKHYAQIAAKSGGCGCRCSCASAAQTAAADPIAADNERIAKSIGYSDEEVNAAAGANLGLGCGNPTAMAGLKPGETVLDLGSGAGFDCFLAVRKVGPTGRAIGVDMTQGMIDRAEANARKYGHGNVEFRLGDIEDLPVDDGSIDVIISNCVVNLAPDKSRVFREAHRVLKPGGRMYLSDIVLLAELTAAQRADEELIAGCVGGALLRDDYLRQITDAGFTVRILSEDKDISKRQYQGVPLESLKVEAVK